MTKQDASLVVPSDIPPYKGRQPKGRTLRFLQEYLKDFSIQAAAARAGMSKGWPSSHGTAVLRRYRDYIDWHQKIQVQQNAKVVAIDQQAVFEEIAKIAFANIQDYVVIDEVNGKRQYRFKRIDELTRDQAAAIKSMQLNKDGSATYEFYDKSNELFKLGRHLGMFSEKVILEHRHRHLHMKLDLSQVPMDVLERMEQELEQYLPKQVIEAQ
jgi:phage terminase small subunit